MQQLNLKHFRRFGICNSLMLNRYNANNKITTNFLQKQKIFLFLKVANNEQMT